MAADATALRASIERWATQVVTVAGPETARAMASDDRVPTKDGKLRQAIRCRNDVKVSGSQRTTTIEAPVIQALTTDRGARPHVIQPRRAGGLLVFDWPKAGGVVFLRSVNHPGNPPRPWWDAVTRDAWRSSLRAAAAATSL